MRGRKPKPTALRRAEGNPGKRGFNHDEPVPDELQIDCPEHLAPVARAEWDRIAEVLREIGLLTLIDRATFAVYCQAYARWVEAEERLASLPAMVKTPSGYVQQNPWIGVANKQIELMTRLAAELGLTPSARSRVGPGLMPAPASEAPQKIERIIITAPKGMDDPEGTRATSPQLIFETDPEAAN